tara:strand:+ start:1653 stop:2555 length:903 start_codon:yes stop_codon:yes gene_type:complete
MTLKFLAAAASGGGGGEFSNVTDTREIVENIASVLATNRSDYWSRLSNPYFYSTDGDSTYVSDGSNDMYDSGNYTEVFVGDNAGNFSVNSDCLISYNNTTRTNIDNTNTQGSAGGGGAYAYACGGYSSSSNNTASSISMPLMVVASAGNTTDSYQPKIGLMKSGNAGADNHTSSYKTNRTLYNGTTVNGFTVYASDVTIHGTHNDPSIVDLYIALLHTNWNSSAGGVTPTVESFPYGFGTAVTDQCSSQFYFNSATQSNIVFIGMLFSEFNSPNSLQPTTTELQNIIGDLTLDIKNYLGY